MDNGFQKSWILILITMCLLFAFGFLGFIPFFAEHEYFLTALGEVSFLLPVFLGLGALKNKNVEKSLRKGFAPSLVPILFLIPFCMQTFVVTITLPLHSLLYRLFGDMPDNVGNAVSAAEFFLQILTVCILPAVIEELLCRGVIMEMLKPYGIVVSMLVSAFAFAILHFSAYSVPVIFMMGILLAAVKLLTGSLWACIFVHFSNNFISLIANLIPENSGWLSEVIAAAAFLLFPILLMRLLKKTRAAQITDTKCKKVTFSPVMCVCLGIFAATIIYETII